MKNSFKLGLIIAITTFLNLSAYAAWERCCIEPDNGTGTVDLPPMSCSWQSFDEPWEIIDGLPPGTTIEIDVILFEFTCCGPDCDICSEEMPSGVCEITGGMMGGTVLCFEATLDMVVRGTGDLTGFSSHLSVPVSCEIHTARALGRAIPTFETTVFGLLGDISGDQDFEELTITAGLNYALISPGEITLTELPSGDFAVDSFFDITYQIEFVGAMGSQLDGYAGTTIAQKRISLCPLLPPCEPTQDGLACKNVTCPVAGDECKPKTVKYDTNTGITTVLECECRGEDECYVDIENIELSCVQPDNGTGTATLPPIDCNYTSPEEVFMIIEGLPPGTTIEMEGILRDFICCGDNCALCSMPLGPGECETEGGSLGGHGHCFEAKLDLDVSGTGELEGFKSYLVVEDVSCEVHTGPRNPGDPVQSFETDFYRFHGGISDDMDFQELIITAGTDFGLPSPGVTTLTELPSGDFAVDSFFDITYQIEFVGAVGSQLEGYAGTTTGTIRMEAGGIPQPPNCTGPCPACQFCEESITPNGDGTIDISCNCIPDADLNQDGKVNFEDMAIMCHQWLRGTAP